MCNACVAENASRVAHWTWDEPIAGKAWSPLTALGSSGMVLLRNDAASATSTRPLLPRPIGLSALARVRVVEVR